MSYCGHCGEKLKEGLRFCTRCGNQIEIEEAKMDSRDGASSCRNATDISKIRNDSIVEIDRMIEFFSVKSSKYDEYELLMERINQATSKCDKVSQSGSRKGGFRTYMFLALTAFWLVFLYDTNSGFTRTEHIVTIGILVLLVLGFVSGVLNMLGISLISIKAKKEIRKNINKLCELEGELEEHYRAYGTCIVGYEYTNPYILQSIRKVLCSGRADSIKEALNVLINDARMDEMQLQLDLAARASVIGAETALCIQSDLLRL